MKQKFIMVSVVIQGLKQPGNDIDVHLRPLIADLLQLWQKEGVRVWDECWGLMQITKNYWLRNPNFPRSIY
jgi:hypothetical protein